MPRLLFRSIWLLVGALQGDPENSGSPGPENSGNFRAPSLGFKGFTVYGLGFRGLIEIVFLAFAVMVWVLSGVVGAGWFWGAEWLGLRLRGWG